MLVTSALMLIMSCSSCSLLYPLLKMTGLFMSITFRQEDQRNRSTRSPSRHNLLKLRNQRKSQSQTFALISPMSSWKRPIMFFPLINPSITPLNSRIPLSQRLQKSTYPLNPAEQEACKAFIEEHLKTGHIVPSKSPQATPFFFILKKDGTLCPCQDYRYLNGHTIRNGYPLLLIPELINDMCYGMKPRPSFFYHSLCPSCDGFTVDLYSCCFFLHRRLSIHDTVVRYRFPDFVSLLSHSMDTYLLRR